MTDEALPVPADEQEDTFLRNIHRLFFRPSFYFSGITAPKKRAWLYLFAFLYGVAYATDRIEIRLLQGVSPPETWTVYWMVVGVSAFVGMFIIHELGGAWYRFRLRLCGIRTSDKALVRMVYLSAAQIYALPTIVAALISSIDRKDPTAAAIGNPAWMGWAMLIFPLWSFYASYSGVRTVFKTKRAAAALWFLVLPVAFFALVLAFSLWAVFSGAPIFSGPAADVERPREFADGNMTFSYPGNWRITKREKTSDLESEVQIESVSNAMIYLTFFKPLDSSEVHMQNWSVSSQEMFKGLAESGSFSEWGNLSGVGRKLEGRVRGTACQGWLFIAPLAEERSLMVMEFLPLAAADRVRPGFELIRKTFRPAR